MMISNNLMFGSVQDFATQALQDLADEIPKIPFINIIFDSQRFNYAHSVLIFISMILLLVLVIIMLTIGNIMYRFFKFCQKKCFCYKCSCLAVICCLKRSGKVKYQVMLFCLVKRADGSEEVLEF